MADETAKFWLEPVWSTDRETESEFDLEEFVHETLEIAKDNLQKDGFLVSAAWVISSQAIHCFRVGFDDLQYKYDAYEALVAEAKELNAEVIVTLNDAYWGDRYDPETYYPGKLAEEGRECIYLTVTASRTSSWSLTAKYTRTEGTIVFEPTERSEGGKTALLGSWPREMREIQ